MRPKGLKALKAWITIDVTDTIYSNKVFVINRGINAAGFSLGLRKAIFTELNAGHYHFTWSNMALAPPPNRMGKTRLPPRTDT